MPKEMLQQMFGLARVNCTTGDSSTEPYLVGHNLIKSHAAAVKLYKAKYQENSEGHNRDHSSIALVVPYSTSIQDLDAAKRSLDFLYGWFMDPVVFGDYPRSMSLLSEEDYPNSPRGIHGSKGSFDFIGLNYYTAFYSSQLPAANITHPSYLTDSLATTRSDRNGRCSLVPREGVKVKDTLHGHYWIILSGNQATQLDLESSILIIKMD
ncbi:beta-glucosidase [Salix suchowensis]|nr:beta-glucosidase [Salix suchowensis]